ncbi:MAG TPA: SIMPL domain-containing protein, partial [Polyangiaceae bacterium]|nr:SIMPL domain-containing protein [Polyangiaceae bacterium]
PHVAQAGALPAVSAPVRGITVAGVGKASGKPDIARTTIGVEARAGTAEEAIGQVNSRMAQVIAAVKAAGVGHADVRTATLSLNFERNYEQPPRPLDAPAPPVAPAGAPAGKTKTAPAAEGAVAPPPKLPQGFYNASNSVEVTIRKLEDAGKVISAATSAGADHLFGIRFEVEDQTALLAQAREKAVQDARQRAERLAQLAGVKLGPAMSITELEGGGGHGPMPMMASAKMMDASAPIERGELTLMTTVQIVYALPE